MSAKGWFHQTRCIGPPSGNAWGSVEGMQKRRSLFMGFSGKPTINSTTHPSDDGVSVSKSRSKAGMMNRSAEPPNIILTQPRMGRL